MTTSDLASPSAPLSPSRAARRAELIDSLTNLTVVPEDAESLQPWNYGTFASFKPRNAWDEWLTQQASVMMFRISRGERIERRLRDLQALRAIDCWEVDQQLAAELTAAAPSDDPTRTYAQLLGSLAGCDWMIRRWEILVAIPVAEWTAEQLDMSRRLHAGSADAILTPGYPAARLAGLRLYREQLRDADRALRALAEADLATAPSAALKEIRRSVAQYQRQLKWYVAQLRVELPDHRLDYRYEPSYVTPRVEPLAPAAVAAPSVVPAEPTNQSADAPHPLEPAAGAQPMTLLDETNPLSSLAADSNPTSTEAEVVLESGDEVLPPLSQGARSHATAKRIDPVRELARARKKARRRSA